MLRIATLLLAAFFMLQYSVLSAQSSTDNEIKRVATELGELLNRKRVDGRLIVFDFTDIDGTPTELGAFLADKISNVLVNVGVDYEIVDRAAVAKAKRSGGRGIGKLLAIVAETELVRETFGTETQNTAVESADAMGTVLGNIPTKDKRLKGIELIIYGTITTIGERYHLDLKAKKKKDDVLVATAAGDISNTQALRSLHGASVQRPLVPSAIAFSTPSPATGGSSSQQFTKQNLQFDLIKCVAKGSSIEVHLRISSLNKDDHLNIYRNSTKIFNQDGGAEFIPSSMNIADITTSSSKVEKELIRNSPVESVFTFHPGEDIAAISKLVVTCYSKVFGAFTVEMADIFVE